MAQHTHSHGHDECHGDHHHDHDLNQFNHLNDDDDDEYMERNSYSNSNPNNLSNPWSNPFCMKEERLLINPITNKYESKEHQSKRLELEHFYSIIHSFEYYATWQFERFQRKHYDWIMLSKKYKLMTKSIPIKFKKIRKAIIQNQSVLTLITQQCNTFISGNRGYAMNPDFIHIDTDQIPSSLNMDKVRIIYILAL